MIKRFFTLLSAALVFLSVNAVTLLTSHYKDWVINGLLSLSGR